MGLVLTCYNFLPQKMIIMKHHILLSMGEMEAICNLAKDSLPLVKKVITFRITIKEQNKGQYQIDSKSY